MPGALPPRALALCPAAPAARRAATAPSIKGEEIKSPHVPASFHVLVNELKALALNVELIGEKKAEDDEEEGLTPTAIKETLEAANMQEAVLDEELDAVIEDDNLEVEIPFSNLAEEDEDDKLS